MLPTIELFGHTISLFYVSFYTGFVSVPVIMLLTRKRYNFSKKQSLFYAAFTLIFGLISAWLTAVLENFMLDLASNGTNTFHDDLRCYGIPIFLPLFYLFYCLLFRDKFRTLSDYVAPSLYCVQMFVKIGCVFMGCCFGPADPHGIYLVDLGYKAFPVQIYDAVFCAAIFVICLILLYTLGKKHVGYISPIGGMLYSIQKGILEEYRVHSTVWEKNFFDTGRTLWQFFLLFLFVGCLIWLIGTIIWEKKGKSDFDTLSNIKLPDLSKTVTKTTTAVKGKYRNWKRKRNNYTHHTKKKK